MSGIPGIFNRDGRPADPDVIARMIGAAPHRGRNGVRCWTSGAVASGHQQMGALPEDVPQPIVAVSREIVVSLDGRLDNRTDLLGQLVPAATVVRTPSDAELVLAAYEKWGDECAAHLLGDFAFAIWDGSRRRMFCARDAMGIKPFYYVLNGRTFAWGSDLRQILASGALPSLAPNEGVVAEYLARDIRTQDETLYVGVKRLPAAHSIVVNATDARVRCYWRLDPSRELRCRDDGEYAEQFASLFRDAVSCRLRNAEGRAAAYLSGGIDSSSVVCTSHATGRPVETFSLVFPDDPLADESAFIDAVAERWNIDAQSVAPVAIDGAACRAHVARRMDTLDLPADLVSESLMANMRDRGVSVVLTGVGGDYCFSGSLLHYADLLRGGDLAGFLRQVWADRSVNDAGWSVWQPFLSGARLSIPPRVRRAVRPAAKRLGMVPSIPDWIDRGFADRVGLEDRLRPATWPDEAPTFARRAVCELFASGWPYLLLENGERSASEYGIEERHPFFDRRLIEFGLAIPESQRWSGRQTKYIIRQAMRGILPDVVRERNGKGDFRASVAEGVEAIGGAALFEHLQHNTSNGWVDQSRVRELYQRTRRMREAEHEDYCDGMFKLWMIGGIELWYGMSFIERTTDARPEAARAGGAFRSVAAPQQWATPPAIPSSDAH